MYRNDFITGYGQRHWSLKNRFSPEGGPFADISLEETAILVDRLAYDFQTNGGVLPDDYTLTLAGKERKKQELVAIVQSKSYLLSLRAIRDFEHSFAQVMDPHKIISEHQSGNRDAQILVRRLQMFPTEGTNVWAEFAFPEYAHYQSQPLESRVEAFFRQNLKDAALLHVHGPSIPGLTQPAVMDLLKDKMPKMRHDLLKAISLGDVSKPGQYLN